MKSKIIWPTVSLAATPHYSFRKCEWTSYLLLLYLWLRKYHWYCTCIDVLCAGQWLLSSLSEPGLAVMMNWVSEGNQTCKPSDRLVHCLMPHSHVVYCKFRQVRKSCIVHILQVWLTGPQVFLIWFISWVTLRLRLCCHNLVTIIHKHRQPPRS